MNKLSPKQLFEQFMNIRNGMDMIQFAADTDPAALDTLEELAQQELAQSDDKGQIRMIQERLDILRRIRAEGPDFIQSHLAQAVETAERLLESHTDVVAQWLLTDDWDTSQAYLEEHRDELLTEEAAALLILLQQGNPEDETIALHRQLLDDCREHGIEAAYATFHQQQAAREELAENPILHAVVAFLQAGDEAEAAQILAEEATLLLTLDARQLLGQFMQVAPQDEDPGTEVLIRSRLALWDQAYAGRRPKRQ